MKIKILIIFLCGLFFLIPSFGITPGFVFNADNIFMDLEAVQGGIGFKVRDINLWLLNVNVRAMLGMYFVDGTDVYQIDAGAVLEFPFFTQDRISPYGGVFFRAGFDKIYIQIPPDSVDPLRWTSTIVRPLTFGGVLGIECFLLDYLSFFAEYEAAMKITTSRLDSNEKLPQDEIKREFNLQMGNDAMIGICIYFKPVIKKDEK